MIALTSWERPSRSTALSFLWGVRTFPPPPQFYRYRMWGWVTRDKKRTQSGWRWMQTSSWSEIKDFQKSPWKTHFFGAGILCSPLPRLVRGKKKPDRGPYSRKLNRLRARNLPIRNKNLLSGPLRFLKKKSLCNLSNDSMYQYCSLSAQWFANNNFPVQTYQVSGLWKLLHKTTTYRSWNEK